MAKSKYLWEGPEWTFDAIKRTYDEIEKIGVGEYGLDIYRNQFEIISAEQMLDAYTSIGLPVNYNHWSFGKRFSRELEKYKKGHMGLAYELVINSNPCINYLMEENTMTTQALVMAHAGMGHNTFFKNNYLYKTWTDADSIVDYLIFAKNYIAALEISEGQKEVETFLDSCHSLMYYGVNQYKHPKKLSLEKEKERQREREDYIQSRVDETYRIIKEKKLKSRIQETIPRSPEENILYFCEKNAPNLKPWQREVIRIVRKIAQYFYPQTQDGVINEGTASFFHYNIMNRLYQKGLMNDASMLEFLTMHTGVINQPKHSQMNIYKLGFEIFSDIKRMCLAPTPEDREYFPQLVGENYLDVVKEVIANYRNESFVRQWLSPKVMRDIGLFALLDDRASEYFYVEAIQDKEGYDKVKNSLAATYEREAFIPRIEIVKADLKTRSLYLKHYDLRNRKLAEDQTRATLRHVVNVWGGNNVVLLNERDEIVDYNVTGKSPVPAASVIFPVII